MSREIASVLRRAAELIDTPAKWCQWSIALTPNGQGCGENHPKASRWCVGGAILRAAFLGGMETHCGYAIVACQRRNGFPHLSFWNDHPLRTHAEVIAALLNAADAEDEGRG